MADHPAGPLARLSRRARTTGDPASLAPADSGQCRTLTENMHLEGVRAGGKRIAHPG